MKDWFKKYFNIIQKEDKLNLIKEQINSDISKLEKALNLANLNHNSVKYKLEKDMLLSKSPDLQREINNRYNNYFSDYIEKANTLVIQIADLRQRKEQYEKNKCTSCILINNKNEILLLKRSATDDFQPNVWCLPGGKVDGNEEILQSATREMLEETGLSKLELHFDRLYELENVDLFYFVAFVNDFYEKQYEEIALNPAEHSNYMWCSQKMWEEMNLILDLKKHINDILNSNLNSSDLAEIKPLPEIKEINLDSEDEFDESFKVIAEAHAKGMIDDETYENAKQAYFYKIKV